MRSCSRRRRVLFRQPETARIAAAAAELELQEHCAAEAIASSLELAQTTDGPAANSFVVLGHWAARVGPGRLCASTMEHKDRKLAHQ